MCANTVEASMLGIGGLVNAVNIDTVEQLVEQSQYIFTTEYLLDNFPILSVILAQKILTIFDEVFGDINEAELVEMLEDVGTDWLMVSVPVWCNCFDEDNLIDSNDEETL